MTFSDELVLLTETLTEADAILLRDALAEQGVRAVYDGDLVAGFRAEAPGLVRVRVAASDLPRARELMESHRLDSGDGVDWSTVDVGEPEDA